MAGQSTFGMILRDARERKGVGLDEAARRLRIRPDILRAIEENDFARMPPRGYARNMVNAYARYLGLNPTEITTRYLDEMRQYQNNITRPSDQTGFDMPAAGRRRTRTSHSGYDEAAPQRSSRRNPPYSERTGRPVYSDRNERNVAYDDYGYSSRGDSRGPRSSRGSQRSGQDYGSVGRQRSYDNLFSMNKSNTILSKLPIIIAAIVIIALLVFIITSAVSCATHKESTNVSNVPITGISDTTANANSNSNANDSANTQTVVENPPSAATFQYNVAEGKTAYIEIYEDDSSTPSAAEEVTGPETATYEVTSTLKFVTTSPSNVVITVDGTEVTPTDDNDGIYEYTVDFPSILSDWKATHKTSNTTNKNTVNTVSNTNNTKNSANTN